MCLSKAGLECSHVAQKTRLAWTIRPDCHPKHILRQGGGANLKSSAKIHDTFGDVSTFCKSSDLPTASSGKLTDILNDPAQCRKVKIELAITVDFMAPLFMLHTIFKVMANSL